jgi:WD40 repeat protein
MVPQPTFTLTLATPGSDAVPVVHSLAFNHNGQLLATGDLDGSVRIVDMRSLTSVLSWPSRGASVLGMAFSFNETELTCIGADGKVRCGIPCWRLCVRSRLTRAASSSWCNGA